jgi:cytochrome c peroxidase
MFTTINIFSQKASQTAFKKFGWFLISTNSRGLLLVLLVFILSNCKETEKDEVKPIVTTDSSQISEPYKIDLPSHFPTPVFNVGAVKFSKDKFDLGKKLFYDGILSLDGSISCGSCHISSGAFSNPDHPTSHGIRDQFGTRNAPPIQNMIWKKEFMWDGGIPDLERVAKAAIENKLEMDESLENVTKKVNAKADYNKLFNKAYGKKEVDPIDLLNALSHFMMPMISANSRYDKYVNGKPEANFSNDEVEGLTLFRSKCAQCHTEPLFTDNSFRNNGLDTLNEKDFGRYDITLREIDKFTYRVPSLRNVTVSQPYMHNGKLFSLESVLKHYNENAKPSKNTDPLLKQANGKTGIALTNEEQRKIILFLRTLQDDKFIFDSRFSEN